MGNSIVGARIESRRKEQGLTLDDIALEIGVARSTIQRYEKGTIERLKIPVIEAIARVLKVSPAWLVGKTDDPTDYAGSNPQQIDNNRMHPLEYFRLKQEAEGQTANDDVSSLTEEERKKKSQDLYTRKLEHVDSDRYPALEKLRTMLNSVSVEEGARIADIADALEQLNAAGQEKAAEYIADLISTGRYSKEGNEDA